jgi:hypothetical protein
MLGKNLGMSVLLCVLACGKNDETQKAAGNAGQAQEVTAQLAMIDSMARALPKVACIARPFTAINAGGWDEMRRKRPCSFARGLSKQRRKLF